MVRRHAQESRIPLWRWICLCLLLSVIPAFGQAQQAPATAREDPRAPDTDTDWGEEDDWGDEDDDLGFEDSGTLSAPGPMARPSVWTLMGTRRYDWAAWSERLSDHPLAKARQSLDLEAYFKYELSCAGCTLRGMLSGHGEYDLAYAHERERYDQPTLDTYEWLVQARENYASFSNGYFELWVGRQIVAWGEGEMMSPLDVVNPRDLRDPGLADLDDIRLAVLSTRAAISRGAHRLELMVVHEKNFGLRSPPLGPFSPLRALMNEGIPETDPPVSIQDLLMGKNLSYEHRINEEATGTFPWSQQVFARWTFRGSGIDLGLYAASLLHQEGTLEVDSSILFSDDDLRLGVRHPRYALVGNSGALPSGAFLIKWELVYAMRKPFTTGDPTTLSLGAEEADSIQGMLGVSYSGVQDLTLTLEGQKTALVDTLSASPFDPEAPSFGGSLRYTTLRERLQLVGAAMVIGFEAELGWLATAAAIYELRDDLKLKLGYITYQPGDDFGPFYGLDTHDRAYAQLRWDFLFP